MKVCTAGALGNSQRVFSVARRSARAPLLGANNRAAVAGGGVDVACHHVLRGGHLHTHQLACTPRVLDGCARGRCDTPRNNIMHVANMLKAIASSNFEMFGGYP